MLFIFVIEESKLVKTLKLNIWLNALQFVRSLFYAFRLNLMSWSSSLHKESREVKLRQCVFSVWLADFLSGTFAHLKMLLQLEAVVQRCSVKNVLLKCSQNWQENACARVSFGTFLWRTPPVAASVLPCFGIDTSKWIRSIVFGTR